MKDRIKTETTDAAQGKPSFGKRLWKRVKGFLLAATNPRFLLCFGLAWIITNGWSYALFALGVMLDIGWMTAVAGGYLAFLWFPFSPEKVVTVAISIFLLRLFFPNDEKTLARLFVEAFGDVILIWHDTLRPCLHNGICTVNEIHGLCGRRPSLSWS